MTLISESNSDGIYIVIFEIQKNSMKHTFHGVYYNVQNNLT